jgi:predicted Zn-dependent protease
MSGADHLKSTFHSLADFVAELVEGDERFTMSFHAEDSSFVRFNQAKVRQPGDVVQRTVHVDLMDGSRHAEAGISISGDPEIDRPRLSRMVMGLREQLPMLPEDPYLLLPDVVTSTENEGENKLPGSADAVERVLEKARGLDFVGIYAAGGIYEGHASSSGQRNWFSSHSFHLDFSAYLQADKAVKGSYAGFEWNDDELAVQLADARKKLEVLRREPKTVPAGKYRVYLSPAAIAEVLDLLAWSGFGLKAWETKQTPFIRMLEEGARLNPAVDLVENTAGGVGPRFNSAGFVKPDRVELISGGELKDPLVSPRSAKEYGRTTNGANAAESPRSLELAAGTIERQRVLEELGEGVYVGNLWYLNFSERKSCRMTGMTRFATFWVEGGEIVAPLNVMRFDESLYRALGENLVGLTKERELLLDAESYGARSTRSALLPGAVIRDFTFTL